MVGWHCQEYTISTEGLDDSGVYKQPGDTAEENKIYTGDPMDCST